MAQQTEAFEVIVGTRLRQNRDQAIARATQLLSEVHEFQEGDIFDVNVYGGGDQRFGIGLCFDTDIIVGDDTGLKNFMDTATEHRSIESVERVSHELVA
jgi:hypothetical protein